ncbi:type II secretion system protein [bacterium]|nr:type II secretion system protein [bacterium]
MTDKKQAFTLAEVLLVLAIIGVIAAVTIPAIMQQSSEKKYAALAKKTLGTLQVAVNTKIASVPIGPGDTTNTLLHWLVEGEGDNNNTLKYIKRDNDTNTLAIQTPDGAIIQTVDEYSTCGTKSSKNSPLGCMFMLNIDLNGAEGPTKTTIEGPYTSLRSEINKKTAYDTIRITVRADGKVRPWAGGGQVGPRTKRYLGIDAMQN